MMRIIGVILFVISASVFAEPISRDMLLHVLGIGLTYGVPESVTYQLQIEESGDPKTGSWGRADAVSVKSSNGYHSRGLFQLFEEPKHLAYLLGKYWYGGDFDINDPLHNAAVALAYLADLHERFGNWYDALCFYNHGNLQTTPASTKAYAWRIVNAEDPSL